MIEKLNSQKFEDPLVCLWGLLWVYVLFHHPFVLLERRFRGLFGISLTFCLELKFVYEFIDLLLYFKKIVFNFRSFFKYLRLLPFCVLSFQALQVIGMNGFENFKLAFPLLNQELQFHSFGAKNLHKASQNMWILFDFDRFDKIFVGLFPGDMIFIIRVNESIHHFFKPAYQCNLVILYNFTFFFLLDHF